MAEGGKSMDKVPSLERQNTDEVEDLPLKIPVRSIYDHFLCPICMCRLSGCCMTTCGHRFCYKCIEEWVNRKHECPVCKSTLNARDLIKDTGHDSLLRTVREERRSAEKEYFKSLVENACDEPFKGDASSGTNIMTPLQLVLQKHLKLSLQQHEAYHQQLIADYKRGLSKISREKGILAQKVIREYPHNPEHPERLARLAEVESKWEEKKEVLDLELEKLERTLANTFDKYLTDHLPPPSVIPLTVTLTVPERKFSCDIVLKPEDSMESILQKLRTLMEQQDMRIVEYPSCEDFEVSIISPFAPLEDGPLAAMATAEDEQELKEVEGMTLIGQVVHRDCRPVLEFGIKTGTELRFKGKIVLDSDVSRLCFAALYVSGQNKTMNYFSCRDCNLKWVCQPCATACHKEHQVLPFISNHKPTWACCHCPKKKKCAIQG